MKRFTSRLFFVILFGLIAAMWVYALFFASKEVANEIADRSWAARAEAICQKAAEERIALADLRQIDQSGTDALIERARIIELATDTIERMLTEIESQQPSDAKGQSIVPLWLADYRTYIVDRRSYANQLLVGNNFPFGESTVQGIPLSEKISTFAADNSMNSCKPPMDLSV